MSVLEINPNVWAAPRHRPPGMRDDVPYQPIVDSRKNDLINRATVLGIKAWYGLPAAGWVSRFNDWRNGGRPAPIQGTPSPVIDLPKAGWRVAVMGDMGEGTIGEEQVAARIGEWAPSHVATLGDNVYPLGREVDYAKRFDPQFGKLLRSAEWRPALGNHDYYNADLRPYFNRFPAAAGHGYYTWKLGPAEFFVLDSEQRLDVDSAQRAWFEQQLAASTAQYRVVQVHRPLVSTNTQMGRFGQYGSLAPLLAKYGVQLVLAGHEHGYERSKPREGTVHIVSGGGGAHMMPNPLPLPGDSQVRVRRHHYMQVAFDAERMVVRAVDTEGTVFDSLELEPHAAAVDAGAGAALAAA